MRIRILILILTGIYSILLPGCTKESDTPEVNDQTELKGQSGNAVDLSEVPPEAKILFERLNAWDREEIDVRECPDKYPGRITSGETNGWISVHKEKLEELGFRVEWDCDTKVYELFKIGP